ncbi:superoxide dismutase [Candidatus Dojkabacteria bacterium]|nr:superoxide dismutase [Candidatus Dojkabacteria bacterium]
MFQLPKLPYDYTALEPHIDAKTMEIHHTKHHQGYTDKLNAALEGEEKLLNMDIMDVLKDIDQVPEGKRQAVINNGGGYANHSMFWSIMSPEPKTEPEGVLLEVIKRDFGSLDKLKEGFNDAATTQFGSGWAWIVVNQKGKLEAVSTKNQDNPIMNGLTPIMGLDVWEHAYYLNYQNKRADYVEAWWNVLDWAAVEKNYSV